jgi:hypothetical protein
MGARIPHVASWHPNQSHIWSLSSARAKRATSTGNACASCGGTQFEPRAVATSGGLAAFTIVNLAAPGVKVPFVAGVVDCERTSVRGVLVNTPPDPEHVELGMDADGRFGAVAGLEGTVATNTMPGVFAQIGMELRAPVRRHEFRVVRPDRGEEPRPLDAEPAGRVPDAVHRRADHESTS